MTKLTSDFSVAASASSKPGYVKLREDLDAVRKLFAQKSFKGAFNMSTWGEHVGDHDPEEKNYCGTTACLAGWMALTGSLHAEWTDDGELETPLDSLTFCTQATQKYGMHPDVAFDLFYRGCDDEGRQHTLETKLAEAASIADDLEARAQAAAATEKTKSAPPPPPLFQRKDSQ